MSLSQKQKTSTCFEDQPVSHSFLRILPGWTVCDTGTGHVVHPVWPSPLLVAWSWQAVSVNSVKLIYGLATAIVGCTPAHTSSSNTSIKSWVSVDSLVFQMTDLLCEAGLGSPNNEARQPAPQWQAGWKQYGGAMMGAAS